MPRGATSPNWGGFQRLYAAGVTRDQIINAINSGLDPLQMPPEYYGLRGGYAPTSVGPGANPVNEWGPPDIPTGASGPSSGEIPGAPPSGPLGDVIGGSTPPFGSLTDITPGAGPSVSNPFAGATPGGYPGAAPSNPFAGAVPGGEPGAIPSNPFAGVSPGTDPGAVPGSPFAGAVPGGAPGAVPSGGWPSNPGNNYYDAGNGITYVYDQNWNYLYTSNSGLPNAAGSAGANIPGNDPFAGATIGGSPGSSPGFNAPPATMPSAPWYTAGPYPGGNTNPQNPGYVARGVGPQPTPEDVAGPSTAAQWGLLGINARNI